MSDSYQPIYDAVRSRLSGCDVGETVRAAIREVNMSHYIEQAAHRIIDAAANYDLPSAIYRPKLSIDGNQWCALYGTDLQDGVAGFGDSPADAMNDFDRAWCRKLNTKEGA